MEDNKVPPGAAEISSGRNTASLSRFSEIHIIFSFEDIVQKSVVENYILDLKRICALHDCPFFSVHITSRGLLQLELDKLAGRAASGLLPLVQIIMHGLPEEGFQCGSDFMPWDRLLYFSRKINVQMKNNLILISSVCYSMRLALSSPITMAVPFYMLIAPAEELYFRDFIPQTLEFFKILFTNRDAIKSFDLSLAQSSRLYHCEEVLLKALVGYLKKYVIGDAAEERIKNLAMQHRFQTGIAPTDAQEAMFKDFAKRFIADRSYLIPRYEDCYLIGRSANFTMDDVEELAAQDSN